ncbi:MAG: phage tail assembly chaperone [Hyphomicrobiaceae bacterium]|nr:phage tail assembly chaperone [Hyphomicrobiaceae bacterium]MCC0010265.1 phage tail assembly chaperone [Hyphomicrobiaceae bacterium]
MAAGLGLLRLEPRAFWLMTPRELEAAMTGLFGSAKFDAPPAPRELQALIAKFPDEIPNADNLRMKL